MAVARLHVRALPCRWPIVGVVVLLLMTALSLPALVGCSHKTDPRAYPGSQSQSLNGELERYHLRLPECAKPTVRYYRFAQWDADTFYLHFSANRTCINEFLAQNEMNGEQQWEEHGLPFGKDVWDRFGWPVDPTRKYSILNHKLGGMGTSTLVDVDVAIDPLADQRDLYLRATIY